MLVRLQPEVVLGGKWALPPVLNCFLRLASVSLVYYMAHLHILHTP
jgi:hypothetical protein